MLPSLKFNRFMLRLSRAKVPTSALHVTNPGLFLCSAILEMEYRWLLTRRMAGRPPGSISGSPTRSRGQAKFGGYTLEPQARCKALTGCLCAWRHGCA